MDQLIRRQVNRVHAGAGALKMTDMKMPDVKLTNQFAGYLQDVKLQNMKIQDIKLRDRKYSVNWDYITIYSVQFLVIVIFLNKHSNALCISYYLFRKSLLNLLLILKQRQ